MKPDSAQPRSLRLMRRVACFLLLGSAATSLLLFTLLSLVERPWTVRVFRAGEKVPRMLKALDLDLALEPRYGDVSRVVATTSLWVPKRLNACGRTYFFRFEGAGAAKIVISGREYPFEHFTTVATLEDDTCHPVKMAFYGVYGTVRLRYKQIYYPNYRPVIWPTTLADCGQRGLYLTDSREVRFEWPR